MSIIVVLLLTVFLFIGQYWPRGRRLPVIRRGIRVMNIIAMSLLWIPVLIAHAIRNMPH
jgi:hypothetical protein